MSLVGLRVLRGPDWNQDDRDGGDGHIGTIVNIGGLKTADVVWDNGQQCVCRIGENGQHDLRIFDRGPVGVRHTEFVCSSCSERGIFGMRWQCKQCNDVNLCPVCYVTDKHNINHPFLRFDTPQSQGISVSKRYSSLRCLSIGLFVGATVTRGRDWNYADQDGESGKIGKVVGLEDAGSSSVRNILRVKWDATGNTQSYRLGGIDGKVDLKFVDQARGPFYYRDHLPVCKYVQKEESTKRKAVDFKQGDRVCIMVSSADLKKIQNLRSSFKTGMAGCIGQTGVVFNSDPNGDINVSFERGSFIFCAEVLIKVPTYNVGDIVRVINDLETLKILQENHSEYDIKMKQYLGKVGQVIKKDSDGDVIVKFGQRIFVFNPACCVPAPGESVDDAIEDEPTTTRDPRSFQERPLVSELEAAIFIGAVIDGKLRLVQQLLDKNPRLLDAMHDGITPLTVASNQGYRGIVLELLERGADINKTNEHGLPPLMAALLGNKQAIGKLLIEKGADVHIKKDGISFLHRAALLDCDEMIESLIQKGCDLNKQDFKGNTPLHLAIIKNSNKTIRLLCKQPNINTEVKNEIECNVLHFACSYGNTRAADLILERNSKLVVSRDNKGASPLHFAVIQKHLDCVKLLTDKWKADVNHQTNNGQTPLHFAALTLDIDIVRYLIDNNANVNVADKDKITPLHACCFSADLMQSMYSIQTSDSVEGRLKVAKYLLENGASPGLRDANGKTAVDVCQDGALKLSLINLIRYRKSTQSQKNKGLETLADKMHLPCTNCYSRPIAVILLPCLHKCVCEKCSETLNVCTVCDKRLTQSIVEPKCWNVL